MALTTLAARPADDGAGRAARFAPRLVLLVITVVFAGFVLNALQYVAAERGTLGHVLPAVLCLAVMMALQLGVFSNPAVEMSSRNGCLALLLQAVVVLAPIAYYGEAWTGMQGFLAGDVLLIADALRAGSSWREHGRSRWIRPAGWFIFGGIAVGTGYVQYGISGVPLEGFYITVLTAVMGLVVYGLSRLRLLVQELYAARSDLARLAVAREHLRFARDLHDLLGYSLTAITLKAELAHVLVDKQPARARQEAIETTDIAREALADVRTLVTSYRELALEDEMASARSTLIAANVEVVVRHEQGELSSPTQTVLATVLREGVTNLLRHSKATRADITVADDGRTAAITIVNDGAGPDEVRDRPGSGIQNLTVRVEALGGSLVAAPGPDRTFRLHAAIPRRPRIAGDPTNEEPRRLRRRLEIAPGSGEIVASAVFVGYAVNASTLIVSVGLGVERAIFAVIAVLSSLGIVLFSFSRPSFNPRSWRGRALLLVLAVAVFSPIVLLHNPYLGLPGLLAGSLLLALPARVAVVLFLGVALSVAAAHFVLGGAWIDITYGFLVTVNQGLVVFALSRLRSTARDLRETRSSLTELAVTSERVRFSQNLYGVLGVALSELTLRSALAHRLVDRDPAGAQRELFAVREASRQALADVRAVADSYHELSQDGPGSAANRDRHGWVS